MAKPWHTLETDEVLKELNVSREGLSSQEARERLAKYGYNEIKKVKRRAALYMFLDEFKDIFILLLIVATIFFSGYRLLGDASWRRIYGGLRRHHHHRRNSGLMCSYRFCSGV